MAEIILFGLFAAGDSAGVVEALVGREVSPGLFVLLAILILGITALNRLARLHEELEKYQSRVRLVARPGSISWNVPDPGPSKIRLTAHIHWEIWTDIDIRTSALALNLVGIRLREWWQIWRVFQSEVKPLMGLRIKGNDTPDYRKTFAAKSPQPIQDNAEFEYEGPLSWDGPVSLVLVLKTGSPPGRFTSTVDPRLWERGSKSPL